VHEDERQCWLRRVRLGAPYSGQPHKYQEPESYAPVASLRHCRTQGKRIWKLRGFSVKVVWCSAI
jgi:hypothetical protein